MVFIISCRVWLRAVVQYKVQGVRNNVKGREARSKGAVRSNYFHPLNSTHLPFALTIIFVFQKFDSHYNMNISRVKCLSPSYLPWRKSEETPDSKPE